MDTFSFIVGNIIPATKVNPKTASHTLPQVAWNLKRVLSKGGCVEYVDPGGPSKAAYEVRPS